MSTKRRRSWGKSTKSICRLYGVNHTRSSPQFVYNHNSCFPPLITHNNRLIPISEAKQETQTSSGCFSKGYVSPGSQLSCALLAVAAAFRIEDPYLHEQVGVVWACKSRAWWALLPSAYLVPIEMCRSLEDGGSLGIYPWSSCSHRDILCPPLPSIFATATARRSLYTRL